jgi:membrane-bound lytic murein transglycosylase B
MRVCVLLACIPLAAALSACSSTPQGGGSESANAPTTTAVARKQATPARASTVSYGTASVAARGGDYASYPATDRLIAKLVREEGFDAAHLQRVFSRVERQQWILDFLNKPKSRKSTGPTGAWTRYRAKFLTQDNITKGSAFWRRYDSVLRRAQAQYGVPPEYVVAIIGVETRYGGYMGKHRVIDALSTLAFDYPRRSEFFTGELEAFLVMSRDEGFDPFAPKGSYAGAMGLGQFMPSSFQKWAVDFDGNGKRDLWNPVDAIGSVANYFASHGWQEGEPVTVRARLEGAAARAMKTGYDTSYSVDDLSRNGVRSTVALDDAGEGFEILVHGLLDVLVLEGELETRGGLR